MNCGAMSCLPTAQINRTEYRSSSVSPQSLSLQRLRRLTIIIFVIVSLLPVCSDHAQVECVTVDLTPPYANGNGSKHQIPDKESDN